jgi:GntR family transcriptional regulator/MocR family aminotransferase
MNELSIHIDSQSYVPVYRQIADIIRKAILDGELGFGQPLPSYRDLAESLGVSRSTVWKTFEDLAHQGYVQNIHGRGTFVAESLPGDTSNMPQLEMRSSPPRTRQNVERSQYWQRLLEHAVRPAEVGQWIDGGPALHMTPLILWRQLLQKHCRMRDLSVLDYKTESLGYPPLRAAYTAYLRRARAVNATADRIVVFSARELRVDLICRLLLEPGDLVAVENPCYPPVRQELLVRGATLRPIPVDDQGMDVDYLVTLPEKIRLVYVTPSHHEPTGAVLSLPRRRKLLQWAEHTGAFIIEDDYDSEFRYGSTPLPSLQGMDTTDSVILRSCFWKILSPVLKLGFLVVPERLQKVVSLAKPLIERDLPLIDQFALTDFINEGHLERHIRWLRKKYARRRQALVQALTTYLGDIATAAEESAGMDLLIHLKTALNDSELLDLAGDARLPMLSSQHYYYMEQGKKGEFIVQFSDFTEEQLHDGVHNLANLLKK